MVNVVLIGELPGRASPAGHRVTAGSHRGPALTPAPTFRPAVVTVVVAVLTVAVALYLLVAYQHPEDRNQAWFPKIVVLLGLCLAIWTVLLFPLDVANLQGCDIGTPQTSCTSTLPMKQLWYAVYIGNFVVTFALVPFAMFYYEADSEW